MIEHLGSWLETALGVLTIASLAGYGSTRARLRDLAGQLVEADAETDRVRRGRADDQAEVAALKTQVATQASDLKALGRVVTNEALMTAIDNRLEEIAATQKKYHAISEAHWERFHERGRE